MIALRVLAILGGIFLLFATLFSAIKTVILPRGAVSVITRLVYLSMRRVFLLIARPGAPFERRDKVLALYAPVSLVAILATWLVLVGVAYTLIFWGVDYVPWRVAFEVSGSSLFTLGVTRAESLGSTALIFSEAGVGLFLLALMITYLPSIYTAFSRRELGVTALAVRAGEPPSGVTMMERFTRLERMPLLTDVWSEWERWFVDIEETHTSLPSLVFFRSPQPDHSWVTAAGAVLDGAALAVSIVDIEHDVQADICIRAGYLSLRRICDYFSVPYDDNPQPGDPISITRAEWEDAVDEMAAAGVALKADRDKAWQDFSGWRVNYDTTLLAMAIITSAPYAPWSSDRSGNRTLRPRMFGKLRTKAPEGPPR